MSLCKKCKHALKNAKPGAGECIYLCDNCSLEDVSKLIENERNYLTLLKMKENHVPIKLDEETEKRFDIIQFNIDMINKSYTPNYKSMIDNFNRFSKQHMEREKNENDPDYMKKILNMGCDEVGSEQSISGMQFKLPPSIALEQLKVAFDKYPFITEHDGAEDMNTFLELLDTLEYSFKNGRTEEAIVLLREKIVNMFNDACWKSEAQLMDSAPLDGTDILIEFKLGFEVCHFSGEDGDYKNQWLDNYEKVVLADPIRWWSLPKQEKKKGHLCHEGDFTCCVDPQGDLHLYHKQCDDYDGYDIKVKVCPFCGYQGEKA